MKLYGLIGYPLGHSFSKKYFTEKFQKEGLADCRYELFPIPSINDILSVLHSNPSLEGLNVTIPYKEQVLSYVTGKSPAVTEIGAANTIKISGNQLTAYNTDVTGFEISFLKKLDDRGGANKKALVLGTGGLSKAVQYVLNKLHISYLLVTRNEQLKPGHINYHGIDEKIMNEYTIIINCTPAGLYPDINQCPSIPYHFISKDHYLFDLIYQPEKTLFLQKGEERGALIQNGHEMLIIQAEESWKIWSSVK